MWSAQGKLNVLYRALSHTSVRFISHHGTYLNIRKRPYLSNSGTNFQLDVNNYLMAEEQYVMIIGSDSDFVFVLGYTPMIQFKGSMLQLDEQRVLDSNNNGNLLIWETLGNANQIWQAVDDDEQSAVKVASYNVHYWTNSQENHRLRT